MTALPYHTRYERDRARFGPSEVDSAGFVAALRYAREAGIPASAIGVDRHYLSETCPWTKVRRATRERALNNLARLLDERQEALDNCRAALTFLAGTQPVRRQGQRLWPVAPLQAEIDRRWPLDDREEGAVPPLAAADRRYLYRNETVDEARADRVCVALGFDPSAIWPTWYELGAVG
jgi:hypothetical protein